VSPLVILRRAAVRRGAGRGGGGARGADAGSTLTRRVMYINSSRKTVQCLRLIADSLTGSACCKGELRSLDRELWVSG